VDGTLYGTTVIGGAYCCGTIFSLDIATNTEKVLYSFRDSPDGCEPLASLIEMDKTLYGTTSCGGYYGNGTAFGLDLKSNDEPWLYSFESSNGYDPVANFIGKKGKIFGTTERGGSYGGGTVFEIYTKTLSYKMVHSFNFEDNDATYPEAGLLNSKGVLYGAASNGGANGSGAVYSIDPITDSEKVVYSFCSQDGCADGETPLAGLIDVGGVLYGTTQLGGSEENNAGVVFALDPATGSETVLHTFCSRKNCVDGQNPVAGLIRVNGVLYGTTSYGGEFGYGTVFSVNPKTKAESVIHSFGNGTDASRPAAPLINVNRTLYGTTTAGGAYGGGTVFAITP
jgi:uncharacterized repeat protein (TIGR03803 family)